MSANDTSIDPRFAHLLPVKREICASFSPDDKCAYCSKTPEQLETNLKRCMGCSRVLYCSKACQRSAWRSHRPLCIPKSASSSVEADAHQRLGYASLMDLTAVLNDWSRVNDYTLETIAQITVFLNGGADYNLASPRAVLIHAEPRVRTSSDMSPAGTFRIKGSEVVNKDERLYLFSGSKWEELQESCAQRAEELRSSGDNPALAGVIPAAIVSFVAGVGTIVAHQEFPIYRPRCRDVTALDNSTRLALMDLMHVCGAGISAGISFHRPARPMRPPDVYRWVLSEKKKWTTVRIKDWNWNVDMRDMMAQHPDHYKSGLRPLMLWSTFRNL